MYELKHKSVWAGWIRAGMNWATIAMKKVGSVLKPVLLVMILCIALFLPSLASLAIYLGCLTVVVFWTFVNWVLRRPENHNLYLLHLQRNIYWYFCFLMLR